MRVRNALRRVVGPEVWPAPYRWLELIRWSAKGFNTPSPRTVKWSVLMRHGGFASTWIESGTFMGSTTAFLARRAAQVITLEPDPELAEGARLRFRHDPKVRVIEATSEAGLPMALEGVSGDVAFWLDGHHSGAGTFLGEAVTPIVQELAFIEAALPSFRRVAVLVDDMRLFARKDSGYPDFSVLTNWAFANSLHCTVEQDIFIAASVSGTG